DRFELSFELPSRCAELLERGDVDLGLIPSASDAAEAGEMAIVPGIAIAGFGPVRTVLLVGEVPWAEMKHIALDSASRSSAMLRRRLCKERALTPRFREVPHDEVLDAASGATGALVIGDAGFAAAGRFPHIVDLGAAWRDVTGLPFVYAVLAGRPGAVGPDDIAVLQQSLEPRLASPRTITRAWADAHRVAAPTALARAWSEADSGDPADYERSQHRDIRFPLGDEEVSGLSAFFD